MNKRVFFLAELGILALVIIFIINNLFFEKDTFQIDKNKYPVNGFDVSKHTGKIDFKTFKDEYPGLIDFVYIKASEGATLVDRNFEENYRNARKHNIKVGAYHFFRFNRPGNVQANLFLKCIKGKKLDLPLVLDVEEWKNSRGASRETVVREIKRFLSIVEKQNTKVLFYSNESSYRRYIEGNFDNHIWICSFNKKPKINKDWIMWQYSHTGRLPGAEGLVDLNTFNGSREEWYDFIKDKKVYYR